MTDALTAAEQRLAQYLADNPLSPEEIDRVRNYMAKKWGLDPETGKAPEPKIIGYAKTGPQE